jgi:hypothetical protein
MKTTFSLPFNSYDFFGYLLPGTLFAFGGAYVFWDKLPLESCLTQESKINAFIVVLVLLGLLAGLYFIGQIIGSISHLLYDRLLVRNIIGYPFQYILDLKPRPEDSMRITYLLLLVCGLQYIIAPTLYELLCMTPLVNIAWICTIIWVTFWTCVFILAFSLRFCLVFSRISGMDNYGRKKTKKRDDDENSIENDGLMKKFCCGGVRVLWYLSVLLRKISSTDTKVNKEIRKKFIDGVKTDYEIDLEKEENYNSDAYWIAYIGLLNANQKHGAKIENWLNLYGCLRNYSCVFLILSIVIAVKQWGEMVNDVTAVSDTKILLAFLGLSFILFIRYWIIFFGYYSKYIIRAFALKEKTE